MQIRNLKSNFVLERSKGTICDLAHISSLHVWPESDVLVTWYLNLKQILKGSKAYQTGSKDSAGLAFLSQEK